ncbi:hypothetical protein K431DRAFT_286678 [Polychaeton citri CBS 116435]|uniref:Uncharacterized protein n=1 Tax=Polychaeton citri CBS 116435 TaxID=1314669 RepID=A0A9P4UNM2_9PEZI|nr:hypothetical protein K431DRAFT_286678 [Polychaeton citri CBS 116435]
MPLFSRKSKAKQADKQASAGEKPKPEPYKHVPKHAASDSIAGGKKGQAGQESVAAQSYKRMQDPAKRGQFTNHAKSHAINHGTGQSGASTPLLSYSSRTGSYEVFTSGQNAPALPSSSASSKGTHLSPSFDTSMLGNPKVLAAARDRGYLNTENSDSGYGSAQNSQTGSVIAPASSNTPLLPLLRSNSSLLPKLSLSEELAQEPAFSEHSFTEDTYPPVDTADASGVADRSNPSEVARQKSFIKRADTSAHRPTLSNDMRSSKSSKSLKSAMKQTRFDVPPNDSKSLQQDWALPQSQSSQQPSLPQTTRMQSPLLTHQSEQQLLGTQHERNFSQPSNHHLALGQVPSGASQRNTIPSLTILDGLKVNKRGRILDEEGDPIGELTEGDLMDCVRQKCNASGEVIDEYGAVVGRVRTLQRGAERTLSPVPQAQQQNDYFQSHFQPPSTGAAVSPGLPYERPKSAAAFFPDQSYHYQPQEYTWPTNQYAVPTNQHNDIPIAQPQPRLPAVSPLDIQSGPAVMELDGTGDSEMMPVMDLSDVFIPQSKAVPRIPSRSPLRPATPSSTNSKTLGKSRSSHSDDSSRSSSENDQIQKPAARPANPQVQDNPPNIPPVPAPETAQKTSAVAPPQPSAAKRWMNAHSILRSKSDAQPPSHRSEPQASATQAVQRPQPPATPPPDSAAAENKSPYSYKGAIPPPENPARIGARSPPLPGSQKQPFSGHIQGIAPFNPLNITPFSGAAGAGGAGPSRRAASQGSVHMQPVRSSVKGRYSQTTPMVRSPLSGQGTTPPDSDEGNSEDGRLAALQQQQQYLRQQQPNTRAASIHSTATSVRTTDKPRGYYSHSVKASTDADQKATGGQTAPHVKRFSTPIPEKQVEKKKSRFSFLSVGKSKNKA